jgi:hypothetical protein
MGEQMQKITWHRPHYDTETGKSIYEDSTGRFEIRWQGPEYGSMWFVYEKDGSPMDIEPRHYLADAKHAAEATIREE